MNDTWDAESLAASRYLADECRSPTRREYVGGTPYAMAGASNAHNQIATNTLLAPGWRLRGSTCRASNPDTKIRLRLSHEQRFHDPDVSVTCRPNPLTDSYQDAPTLVVEVLSEETRRIDEGEKRLACTAIPSLTTYVMLEQQTARAGVLRRTATGFVREVHTHGTTIPLPALGIDLPLVEAYDGMTFPNDA